MREGGGGRSVDIFSKRDYQGLFGGGNYPRGDYTFVEPDPLKKKRGWGGRRP